MYIYFCCLLSLSPSSPLKENIASISTLEFGVESNAHLLLTPLIAKYKGQQALLQGDWHAFEFNMSSSTDLEKAKDLDNGTTHTESTSYQSDLEKAEPKYINEGAVGEPDSDHDEVEQMDEGHLDDLTRQRVSQELS